MELLAFVADETCGLLVQRAAWLARSCRWLGSSGGVDSGPFVASRAGGMAILGAHGLADSARTCIR